MIFNDHVLANIIIDRSWDTQTGAQIVLDVLAEIRDRQALDIRPDESLTYLAEFKVGYQDRYYTPRQILDRMAEYYNVDWCVTVTPEGARLTFTRRGGERLIDMLLRYRGAH